MSLADQIGKDAPPPPPPADAEKERLQAWYDKVKKMHRWKRFAGIVGCCIAVIILLLGKYTDNPPTWAIPVGLVVAGLSWALFIYIIVDRWLWVKRNPYKPLPKP